MVTLDSETFFNGTAALIGTIAILIFILNVDLGYSPVSKISLVLAFAAGIFVITQRAREYQVTVLGYGVIVTTGVALFFDVVNTFSVDNTLTVFGLLAAAGLLFYLRTRLDEDSQFVTGRQATYAFGVIAVLAVAVILVDVVTGVPLYELQPKSEIEYPDSSGQGVRERLRIASVVVTNPTPLPERVDTPQYRACTAGDWSPFRPSAQGEGPRTVEIDVHVDDGYNEHVFGYSTKRYPVQLHLYGTNLHGETFPVEVTDSCPDRGTGPPYIALFQASRDQHSLRPR